MRKTTLAGLLLAALCLGGLATRSADAGPPSTYIQCVHVKTGSIVQKVENLENGKADVFTVPEGWTPVAGYGSLNGSLGITVLCR